MISLGFLGYILYIIKIKHYLLSLSSKHLLKTNSILIDYAYYLIIMVNLEPSLPILPIMEFNIVVLVQKHLNKMGRLNAR